MNIIQPEQGDTAYKENTVTAKKLLSKSEVEVVRVEMTPGSSLPVHSTPVEVFFFIIEGHGEVEIGEEREAVTAGALVESPKNVPHGLHNTSDSSLKILAVKTPKP